MAGKNIRIAMLGHQPIPVNTPEGVRRGGQRVDHPTPWLRNLATSLAQRDDAKVAVITYTRMVRQRWETTESNVRWIFLPKPYPGHVDPLPLHLPMRLALTQEIQRGAYDIVHGHGTESGYSMAAVQQGIPHVISLQGIMDQLRLYLPWGKALQWLRILLEKKTVRSAKALVAKTGFAAKWARETGCDAEIRIIPNAIQECFFDVQSKFDRKQFLCIGTLYRAKGQDVVIKAWAKSKFAQKEGRLSIIGEGPLDSDYRALAAELGVGDSIDFVNRMEREELMKAMEGSCGLLHGARMDTSPNVITEAHAAGLPVISTAAGGIPEMIRDGEDGFLVPREDAEAVADKIDIILGDMILAQRMGQAGRNKVQRLNAPSRIASEHMAFYQDIVN